eukprot:GHRQ01009323.1.p2 GENE.GHRQ01009323.1~~GHRQ01009323.1.p2  ORF type:complete len:119 (-),score=13.14 GHRQ01009323.1:1224-1580(-)
MLLHCWPAAEGAGSRCRLPDPAMPLHLLRLLGTVQPLPFLPRKRSAAPAVAPCCCHAHVKSMEKPIMMQDRPTQGLSRSPTLAAFQNRPRNLQNISGSAAVLVDAAERCRAVVCPPRW